MQGRPRLESTPKQKGQLFRRVESFFLKSTSIFLKMIKEFVKSLDEESK